MVHRALLAFDFGEFGFKFQDSLLAGRIRSMISWKKRLDVLCNIPGEGLGGFRGLEAGWQGT